MSDVAASAGYYMATGAGDIVAENLSLTTSIGGASKNFIAANLWENIDSEVVVIKRGRKYARSVPLSCILLARMKQS